MVDSPKAIFEQFCAARAAKDNEKAATFCHPDVILKTPKESAEGLEKVKKAWGEADKRDTPNWEPIQENGDKPFREVKLSFI